jgi:predicted RNA methylase
MEIQEAVDLLRDAVGDSTGIWADLGAGIGTFTLALAELLGDGSTIYAVDADANAAHALGELPAVGETRIVPVKGDFTRPPRSSCRVWGRAARRSTDC